MTDWEGETWSERSFRTLVDELPDLVCRYTPDGTLLYANRAYAAFHGREAQELIGTNFLDLVDPDLRPFVVRTLDELRQLTPDDAIRRNEHASKSAAGEIHWHEWTDKAFFASDGRLLGFMAVGRDVTRRRLAETRATHDAVHDPLTGLPNRRMLLQHLGALLAALEGADETVHGVAVLYLDLDGFKAINDAHGHRVGDLTLVKVAECLREAVRVDDVFGRLGGDEFLVICSAVRQDRTLDGLADRLRASLRELDPPLSVSIGEVWAEPGESAEDVLDRADRAMYADKAGRSTST